MADVESALLALISAADAVGLAREVDAWAVSMARHVDAGRPLAEQMDDHAERVMLAWIASAVDGTTTAWALAAILSGEMPQEQVSDA